MPKCVYCHSEKSQIDFSQEHVIPRGIGGNFYPVNPFSLDKVCRHCNSLCGAYIDGPFIKNWFTKNYGTAAIYKYADITKNPILPLTYMGTFNEISFEDRFCEFWLGPTGDRIYHFHRPYPEEPDVAPMVGVPTYAKKSQIDHGFVFLFIRSNNIAWHLTIFRSFIDHFEGSTLYLGNGPTPQGGGFFEIPEEMRRLHSQLADLNGKTHHVDLSLDVSFGDRFMAKLALGIGALFLHDSFISSASADLLRRFLWTKKREDRQNIPIMGTRFLNKSDDKCDQILRWPGGHIIALLPVKDSFILYVSFYEKHCATIKVSSELEHWKETELEKGMVYVMAPGLQKYIGPKRLETYIAHKNSDSKDRELLGLEMEMSLHKELPPYDI